MRREERKGRDEGDNRSGREKHESQRRHERLRSQIRCDYWRGREKARGRWRSWSHNSRRRADWSRRHGSFRYGRQRRSFFRTSTKRFDSPQRRKRPRSGRRGESFLPLSPGTRTIQLNRRFNLSATERGPVGIETEEDGEADCEGGAYAVFIDNISREADERAIRWLLRMDENIVSVFISRKRRPNNKLAFAFVRLVSLKSVKQAVERVHGRTFLGHRIFAQRAKYAMKCEIGATGRLSNRKNSKGKVAPLFGASEGAQQASDCGGNAKSSGAGGGDADLESADVVELVVGGACVKDGGVRLEKTMNMKSQARLRIVVNCCCRSRDSAHEESSLKAEAVSSPTPSIEKPALVGTSNIDEGKDWTGNLVSGVQYVHWISAPFAGWFYPSVGYWPSYLVQGCDQYDWWGQMQGGGGGYRWPYDSGLDWRSPVVGQPNPPPASSMPNVSNGILSHGAAGLGVRPPISIREPLIGNRQVPDPVMEDIVRSVRGGADEDVMGFDKMGSGAELGAGIGLGGDDVEGHFIRPSPDHIEPQARMMEEEVEEFGLRNLFEDPEFPPGFEPVGGPPRPEDDPEETFVKEEARQTLIFAKQLGCSVRDEELALSNFEKMIREQRTSYRQRCQEASEGSKEESVGYSRNTSKDRSRKVPGARSVGFSKLSRVSKIAMRGKKKAK